MKYTRAYFNSDLNVVREEIMALQQKLANRVDALDDYHKCKNLKLRGIAETVEDEELPHFVRRLLTTLLPQRQVKSLPIESCHQLPTLNKTPAGVPRDVLICFSSFRDKKQVLETLRTQSAIQFETSSLTALQDLCQSTLEWSQAYMPYHWGTAHSLLATNSATFLQSLGISSHNMGHFNNYPFCSTLCHRHRMNSVLHTGHTLPAIRFLQ
ncbi:Hypothetical predicted protein [Pelobates cultripes]|uniref:Uncharacterized protein n=1 Tax=Pelobates cultripes TaxID=61616 RepID=A0AAD1S5Z6_PELCU|nr:Hypothetical predicted protein [Pelobates cultripes]